MNHSKLRNFLYTLLLVASLLSGMILSPVTMIKAKAKTKLSVTARVGSKKVNKKTIHMKRVAAEKSNCLLYQSSQKLRKHTNPQGRILCLSAGQES